jgi:hypothetical protein
MGSRRGVFDSAAAGRCEVDRRGVADGDCVEACSRTLAQLRRGASGYWVRLVRN